MQKGVQGFRVINVRPEHDAKRPYTFWYDARV